MKKNILPKIKGFCIDCKYFTKGRYGEFYCKSLNIIPTPKFYCSEFKIKEQYESNTKTK